tara:strand:- start:295 stop:501 length:207 start_codon:yes stop_codon:yes gene_type:complete
VVADLVVPYQQIMEHQDQTQFFLQLHLLVEEVAVVILVLNQIKMVWMVDQVVAVVVIYQLVVAVTLHL